MEHGQTLLIGNGQVTVLTGPQGVTPDCPEALFRKNQVVRVRRLKHLRDLPELAVIVACVPPGFSPDWAWADVLGKPRPLMCQVPARHVQYLIAFAGNPTPVLMREKNLLPSNEPDAEIRFADQNNEGDEIDNSHTPSADYPANGS